MSLFRATLRFISIAVIAPFFLVVLSAALDAQQADRPAPRRNGPRRRPPGFQQPPVPVPNVFRNLFGTGAPERAKPTSDDDSASTDRRRPRDDIDGRIPHNTTQGKQLEHAEQLIASSQWEQALERIELVLANSDHATIRTPDGRPGLAAWEANRLLSRLPAQSRETYRLRHEAQARQIDRDARQNGNWDQVMDVATRFFHTETGQRAADSLGNYHFDRGEFGLAALWYARLLESAPPWSQDPKWRLKVALTLRESGNATASDELLRRIHPGGASAPIDVGGDPVKPDAWLRKISGIDLGAAPVLSDWLQFLGNARRTGSASGGEPLLLSRWFHPTTQNHLVLDQLQALAQDLADTGRAAIPTSFPLMIKDRIAFRTLRGVHVIEAATGRLVWETPAPFTEETLVTGHRSGFDFEGRFAFPRFRSPWGPEFSSGEGADGHPLTGLLYRDPNFGLLSSDGTRIFVVEDSALICHGVGGTGFQILGDGLENQRKITPGNRLTAFDLASGREAWTIGGPANGESFDLPLAGHFFFGAPLVDGGELFAVAEKDLDVRLYAIDPETGHVRWSQLLAHSDTKIEQDLGRRWWTAQVAFSNGILVCPTTVGWLVGVDRLDHSVLWMHRFAAPRPWAARREREQGEAAVAPSPLNDQWCPSAPMIAGNRVVYAPAEEPTNSTPLVCLDLSSGVARWQFQKGEEQLYLAAVDDERVIVVGKSSVTSLALETGAIQWTRPIDEALGFPVGRGVAADGKFYLPLKNGTLWSLEMATGKVVERSQVFPGSKPLGNLAMHRGLVLSQSAFGLTAFEQKAAIQRQIADRQKANPRDPWAAVKQAEIALLADEPRRAIDALDRIDAARVDPSLTALVHSVLVRGLTTLVERDYRAGDRYIDRLADVARAPEEKFLVGRLQAERALALREFAKAFEALRLLAAAGRPGLVLVRPDDPNVRVDVDRWIGGQLADAWAKMAPADRTQAGRVLTHEAEHALRGGKGSQQRFLRLYAFHPAARQVADALVRDFATERDLSGAERLLCRMIRGDDRPFAAAAQIRLARLLDEFGLPDDADEAWRELGRAFAGVSVERKTTADVLAAERRSAGLAPNEASSTGPDWGDFDLRIHRFGANYLSPQVEELTLGANGMPFFKSHRFSIDQRRQRLEVVRAHDDAQHWLLPLRSPVGTRQGEYTVAIPAGHQLAVLHRDVLHYLDPVTRRVIWTRPLEVPTGLGAEYRLPQAAVPQPVRSGSGLTSRSLLSRASQHGMLAAANTEYVCVYGRREIIVLDAETGDVRWRRSNLPAHSTVFGNEEVVYLLPPDRSTAVAFRAADGKTLERGKQLGDLLVSAVAVTPRGLVVVDGVSTGILGIQAPRTVVRLVDPISGKECWKLEYLGGTLLTLLDETRMLAVSASGDIERVDFASGDVRQFEGKYSANDLRSAADLFAMADRDRVYLVKSPRHTRSYPEGFRSLSVGGRVVAFDATDGRLLWTHELSSSHNLVLDFFHDSPLMTFVSRRVVERHDFSYWRINFLVLDKRTGREVLSSAEPAASSLSTLELNMAERYIELRSYNQRVRLIAVNRASASAKK